MAAPPTIGLPVAVITGDAPTTVPASALPHTVNLDGSSSTFGTTDEEGTAAVGSSITTWTWYLDKPPESAAVIIDPGTSTPSYVMDVPGTYAARLRVTNNLGVQSEGFGVRLATFDVDGELYPFKYSAPASAYYQTSAALAVSGLVPPTEGAFGFAPFLRALFMHTEQLTADVRSSVGRVDFEVHAVPGVGSAGATGDVSQPFNATSAAAEGFAGPIEQAIDALESMDLSAAPARGRTLHLYAGTFTEDINILLADTPWTIIVHGEVLLAASKHVTHTTAAVVDQLFRPDFRVAPAYRGSYLMQVSGGDLRLGNVNGTYNIFLTDYVCRNVIVQGSFAAGPVMFTSGTTGFGVNVPNLVLGWCEGTRFGDVVARALRRADLCVFLGDVTLSHVAFTSSGDGFYGCAWGNEPVFNSPAGGARFDDVTLRRFFDARGTFTGADPNDAASTKDASAARILRRMVTPKTITGPSPGSTTEFFDGTIPFLDFGAAAGWRYRVEGVIEVGLAGGETTKLELLVSGSSGAPDTVIATQSAPIAGAISLRVVLSAEVTIQSVGDPAHIAWSYKVVSNGLIVDEADGAYQSDFDLLPNVLRFSMRINTATGFVGSAVARDMTVEAFPPGV